MLLDLRCLQLHEVPPDAVTETDVSGPEVFGADPNAIEVTRG
jgi:hypothetical protein